MLTDDQRRSLRCLAEMMIPASAEYAVPSAADEAIFGEILQSLGSDIDTKCLAALENWHFRPATRNGSPVPSKQDAVFPFRARG